MTEDRAIMSVYSSDEDRLHRRSIHRVAHVPRGQVLRRTIAAATGEDGYGKICCYELSGTHTLLVCWCPALTSAALLVRRGPLAALLVSRVVATFKGDIEGQLLML